MLTDSAAATTDAIWESYVIKLSFKHTRTRTRTHTHTHTHSHTHMHTHTCASTYTHACSQAVKQAILKAMDASSANPGLAQAFIGLLSR